MTKQEQETLKRIVEALEHEEYTEFCSGLSLEDDEDFKRLKELANRERFTEVQPKPLSSLTFSQLLEMKLEAQGKQYESSNRFRKVVDFLEHEIDQRLLALFPDEKS